MASILFHLVIFFPLFGEPIIHMPCHALRYNSSPPIPNDNLYITICKACATHSMRLDTFKKEKKKRKKKRREDE